MNPDRPTNRTDPDHHHHHHHAVHSTPRVSPGIRVAPADGHIQEIPS